MAEINTPINTYRKEAYAGFNSAVLISKFGNQNIHMAITGIPIRITAIFKKIVEYGFIKSTSLLFSIYRISHLLLFINKSLLIYNVNLLFVLFVLFYN
jgi:hypothetical protein